MALCTQSARTQPGTLTTLGGARTSVVVENSQNSEMCPVAEESHKRIFCIIIMLIDCHVKY